MRHIYFTTILFLILLLSGSSNLFAQTATAPSGSGTSVDPYLIANLENLYWLTQNSSSWASHFKQTADIDASSSTSWHSRKGFTPIGNNSVKFTGTYDGDDFTISGVLINRGSGSIGFFGYTEGAQIINVGLVDVSITGRSGTGGLAGFAYDSNITNSYVTGRIFAKSYDGQVGGLVGWSEKSNITDCYTATLVEVPNGREVGGLVGSNYYSNISGSYVREYDSLGEHNGIMYQVRGGDEVGGLVGDNTVGDIIDAYSEITVYSSGNSNFDRVGGLVGKSGFGGTIKNSFANGKVYRGSNGSSDGDIGFFIGALGNGTTLLNNYFNSEIGGTPVRGIGNLFSARLGSTIPKPDPRTQTVTGLTATQMKQQASFNGFDFLSTWGIVENNTTPFLLSTFELSIPDSLDGNGTSNDPYLIHSLVDLLHISRDSNLWDKHFKQTADIDALLSKYLDDGDGGEAEGFTPIGTNASRFTGTYDGNGKTISNLYINRGSSDNIGFFGYLDGGSVVHSLGIKDAQVMGGNRVGALVGTAQGATLYDVYSMGYVTGSDWVGGLIGWLQSNSILNRSYSTSKVQASTTAGGLIGYVVSSTVENTFATGSVSATNNQAGGLIGFNFGGTITNSYATGLVQNNGTQLGAFVGGNNATGTITNSYWNSEMSGMAEAIGLNNNNQVVADLSNLQMTDSSNFSAWDFASDSVWSINQGLTFPYLPATGGYTIVIATIDGSEGWKMIGHGGNATYDQFLKPLWTQGFEGSDAGSSPTSNVYFYDETIQNWAAPTSADNYFGTADTVKNTGINGALIYVYADDDNDGTDDSWPKYIVAENSNLNESIDVSLSYTDSVNADSAGWHLLSNPYPVSLDWTEVVTNNDVANSFPIAYFWDDTLNSGSGGYKVNFGFPLPPGFDEDFVFDGIIPAMKAFWVKATGENASISFKPSHQSTGHVQLKSSGSNLSDASWLKLNIQNGAYSDQITLFGTSENGYSYDVPKLRTISFNYVEMEILSDESKWLSRTLADSVQEFPLNVLSTESGEFTFSWDFDEYFFDLYDVSLVDTLSGIEIMLSEETSHSFILGENGFPGFKLIVIPKLGVSTEADSDLPKTFELSQNYPNPFNPSTTIDYQLPQRSEVKLMVFDVLGRLVSTLVDDNQAAGVYNIRFDASHLASGIYLYTLQTGNTVITKKMMLIK